MLVCVQITIMVSHDAKHDIFEMEVTLWYTLHVNLGVYNKYSLIVTTESFQACNLTYQKILLDRACLPTDNGLQAMSYSAMQSSNLVFRPDLCFGERKKTMNKQEIVKLYS